MLNIVKLKESLSYDSTTGMFCWKVSKRGISKGDVAGNFTGKYVKICLDGVQYYAHRLAWAYVTGNEPTCEIDHIDGNRHNNRIDNLREATRQQNARNISRSRVNTSGHKGISRTFVKNGGYEYWLAVVEVGNHRRTKTFPYNDHGLELAIQWRKNMATILHGEYVNHG